MPWKASKPVDLRMEMMGRLGRGEKLTDLCREYGISRKTGEKFKKRFKELGPSCLEDQSRAPRLIPHKTPPELVEVILAERRRHPTWGPRINTQRPHEALDMQRPADVYTPSTRQHPVFLPDPDYPTHDDALRVSKLGLIHLPGRRQVHLTKALAGQLVGIREERDDRWLVTFVNIDLGHIEPRCNRFTPITLSCPPAAN